jgi:hypothetical protein
MVMSRKILFVAYGGGHISMVLPVMQQLRLLDPKVSCVLLALTTGYALAQKAGEQPLGYRDFLHLVDAKAALQWGEALLGGNSSPDVSREESVAYLGINYLDLIAQHGEAGAAQVFSEKGRYGFAPLRFMTSLMHELKPDVVVTTNSPRSEEAALTVAVARGIPSVGMVDLFGLDTDPYSLRDVKPDFTCVLADSVRERLVARGFAGDGVKVTGNPGFDGLFTPQNRDLAHAFLARKGWLGKDVIFNAGSWEPVAHPDTPIPAGLTFPVEIEGILRRYVSNRPNTVLIQRYHPGDWFKYPRLPEEADIHFSEPPNEPIHPLLIASSVVVNTNSTLGLEAAVLGKPVISIENSPSVHHWFSLAKLGVSHPSATHLDLPATLNAVLSHRRCSSAFTSDGLAAQRVAYVILDAAKKPGPYAQQQHAQHGSAG